MSGRYYLSMNEIRHALLRLRRHRARPTRLEAELRRERPQAPEELVARLVAAMEASAPRRLVPRRLATGFALTLVFAIAAGATGGVGLAAKSAAQAVAAVTTAASPAASRVTICHATGSSSNPYVTITVSSNGLNGHGGHSGDIVPAPGGVCPTGGPPPPPPPPPPADDQYKPGKGCGDKNHVHFKEGQCKAKKPKT